MAQSAPAAAEAGFTPPDETAPAAATVEAAPPEPAAPAPAKPKPARPGARREDRPTRVDGVADDAAEIEASRAPLLDHLIELRRRLIVCAAAIAVGFVICFVFSTQILVFLLAPFERAQGLLAVQQATGAHRGPFDLLLAMIGLKSIASVHVQQVHMVFTAPLEVFFEKVKLAVFAAIVLTFPVLATQLYRFVAPGLYRRERRAFLPFLLASPVLFLLGAALVYFVMLPFVLWFSLNQQITGDAHISVRCCRRSPTTSTWSRRCCSASGSASSCRWCWRCLAWPAWSPAAS